MRRYDTAGGAAPPPAADSSQDAGSDEHGNRRIPRGYGGAISVWMAAHAGQRGKIVTSGSIIDCHLRKPAHVLRRLEAERQWKARG